MSATRETIQSLPPYLAAAYKEAAERALKLSQEPYEAYQGRRKAEQPLSYHHAITLAQQTGSYAPYLAKAHHHAQAGVKQFPSHYQEYMKPYEESVVAPLERLGQKNFTGSFMPELEKRFASHGPGLARHPDFAALANQDAQGEIRSQQEDAMSRGYQHALNALDMDRERALDASGLFNRFGVTQQAGQLSDVQALREAGMLSQDQEQALLDQAYEDWKEGKRHPYEKLMEYFSILQGTPAVPSVYEKRETAQPSDTYHHGDWRNIAEGMGLNALGSMLSGQGFSPALFSSLLNQVSPETAHIQVAQGPSQKEIEEQRELERQSARQADIERMRQIEIAGIQHNISRLAATGSHYTQYSVDEMEKQAAARIKAQADALEAKRDAEAQERAAEEFRRAASGKEKKKKIERESVGESFGKKYSFGDFGAKIGAPKPRVVDSSPLGLKLQSTPFDNYKVKNPNTGGHIKGTIKGKLVNSKVYVRSKDLEAHPDMFDPTKHARHGNWYIMDV